MLFYKFFSFIIIYSCALVHESLAHRIDEYFEGQAKAYIGFGMQISSIDDNAVSKSKFYTFPSISLGYNVYLNTYEYVKPFIGVELTGQIPVFNGKYTEETYGNGLSASKTYQEVFLGH